ncbi:MAG: laccase domain-containing protein [Erysipelotrichaceae bacterium]|nr:laccase domain-containing protein [Erysipelotrichaceae bacterium]
MEKSKHVSKAEICTGRIHGGITMRDLSAPENGNQALHVCQNPEEVLKNRRALAEETLPLERWALIWQKHTDNFVRVDSSHAGRGALDKNDSIMNADAVYTTDPEVLIGVYTADCLGLLLCDESTPLVGAIHSGWKGTVRNIVYKTLRYLLEENLVHPETLQVFFSPSIGYDSFEIGPDVREQLLESGKEIGLDYSDLFKKGEEDRWFADHQAMNLRVLHLLGIPEQNIHSSSTDTKTTDTAFSFRRDQSCTGEHFTYGWISKEEQ